MLHDIAHPYRATGGDVNRATDAALGDRGERGRDVVDVEEVSQLLARCRRAPHDPRAARASPMAQVVAGPRVARRDRTAVPRRDSSACLRRCAPTVRMPPVLRVRTPSTGRGGSARRAARRSARTRSTCRARRCGRTRSRSAHARGVRPRPRERRCPATSDIPRRRDPCAVDAGLRRCSGNELANRRPRPPRSRRSNRMPVSVAEPRARIGPAHHRVDIDAPARAARVRPAIRRTRQRRSRARARFSAAARPSRTGSRSRRDRDVDFAPGRADACTRSPRSRTDRSCP